MGKTLLFLFHLGRQKVVFLQHGLLDSAHTWVNNLPDESLGFILADNCYDVWLGNSRGSTYSSNHQYLNPDDKEFWEFSWDEMGKHDIPATLMYILNYTNAEKLSYIGHSQVSVCWNTFGLNYLFIFHRNILNSLFTVWTKSYFL